MSVVFGVVVGYTAHFGVNIRTAQVLGADALPRGGFYQWWATQEDRALLFNNDGLIRHGRNISSTSRT